MGVSEKKLKSIAFDLDTKAFWCLFAIFRKCYKVLLLNKGIQ